MKISKWIITLIFLILDIVAYLNEAINRLKNKSSYGHDEISNKIIRSAKNALIHPLKLIIKQMLMTGELQVI